MIVKCYLIPFLVVLGVSCVKKDNSAQENHEKFNQILTEQRQKRDYSEDELKDLNDKLINLQGELEKKESVNLAASEKVSNPESTAEDKTNIQPSVSEVNENKDANGANKELNDLKTEIESVKDQIKKLSESIYLLPVTGRLQLALGFKHDVIKEVEFNYIAYHTGKVSYSGFIRGVLAGQEIKKYFWNSRTLEKNLIASEYFKKNNSIKILKANFNVTSVDKDKIMADVELDNTSDFMNSKGSVQLSGTVHLIQIENLEITGDITLRADNILIKEEIKLASIKIPLVNVGPVNAIPYFYTPYN